MFAPDVGHRQGVVWVGERAELESAGRSGRTQCVEADAVQLCKRPLAAGDIQELFRRRGTVGRELNIGRGGDGNVFDGDRGSEHVPAGAGVVGIHDAQRVGRCIVCDEAGGIRRGLIPDQAGHILRHRAEVAGNCNDGVLDRGLPDEIDAHAVQRTLNARRDKVKLPIERATRRRTEVCRANRGTNARNERHAHGRAAQHARRTNAVRNTVNKRPRIARRRVGRQIVDRIIRVRQTDRAGHTDLGERRIVRCDPHQARQHARVIGDAFVQAHENRVVLNVDRERQPFDLPDDHTNRRRSDRRTRGRLRQRQQRIGRDIGRCRRGRNVQSARGRIDRQRAEIRDDFPPRIDDWRSIRVGERARHLVHLDNRWVCRREHGFVVDDHADFRRVHARIAVEIVHRNQQFARIVERHRRHALERLARGRVGDIAHESRHTRIRVDAEQTRGTRFAHRVDGPAERVDRGRMHLRQRLVERRKNIVAQRRALNGRHLRALRVIVVETNERVLLCFIRNPRVERVRRAARAHG